MSQLLQNALYGAAMILAVSLLRRVLRDRLVPEARLALWAVCLFRLLTPAAPESALSLWGLSRLFAPEKQAQSTPPVTGYVLPTGAPAPTPQPAPGIPWETVLAAVWLAVGAALAVRYALSWVRTRRSVACAIPLDSRDPRYASLPSFARLREGAMEGAPLTFGVARPTVVLSPGLDGAALDCVLAHEGVHARRRDNLWHYAMALALAVHWWNPAVWLMARLLRRDIELSCDRAALRKLGEDRRADYANALLTLATQGTDPAFCQTFGRKAAEERILSIMKFKKTSIIGVIFTLSLVLAVTAAFASEPKEPDEDSTTFSCDNIRAWSMSTDADNALKDFSINVDYLEENLAQHVADGTMTQEEADRVLAKARQAAQDGELYWTFPADSGLVNNHFDENGDYRPGFNIFYKDPDGNMIPVDPATVVSGFIFPASNDLPAYVEEGEFNEDMPNQLVGDDEGKTINDYDVKLPTFDEDGNPVSSDYSIIGSIGSQVYNGYELVTDPSAVSSTVTGGEAVPVTPSVSAEPVAAQPLVNTAPFIACGEAGCTVSGEHHHENGEVVYHYETQPMLIEQCPIEGCNEIVAHQHDGRWYCFMHYVCPIEGCTTPGEHIHDGVPYSCNGFHSGGHCDGYCYTYNQSSNTTSGAHHSESHSSGHHGNGHH